MITMGEKYGDGTKCLVCEECGLCIDHGDCKAYGCGKEVGKTMTLASSVNLLVIRKDLNKFKVDKVNFSGWVVAPPIEQFLNELCEKHNALVDYLTAGV